MHDFADLLNRLIFMPSRNGKIRLMADYFARHDDPERGWVLAALTGELDFKNAKAGMIKDLIKDRADPVLFRYSYDYVGDLAETVACMWPAEKSSRNSKPDLDEIIQTLRAAKRKDIPGIVRSWLDILGPDERYAVIKLITGALRIGVSARLAKTALAEYGRVAVQDIEEVWHAIDPPYIRLFEWLEGQADKPDVTDQPVFRPLMLANPLEDEDREKLNPDDYRAEWKWDGIRVQLVCRAGQARIYSRTGDDISTSFPDVAGDMDFDAVLDGELLVMREGEVQSFNDLQQRLNRKNVTQGMMDACPAYVRIYDILQEGDEDLRALPFDRRRERLEQWYGGHSHLSRFDLSAMVEFNSWEELGKLKETVSEDAGHVHVEGVMIKHKDSAYEPGRPKGPWFKWKRTPPTIDCVLLYAQRGHGKRSSFYSDYTFGCWRPDDRGGEELVPVGKAYFGFTDDELKQIDKWVRDHTIDKFGPVREVEKGLVFEIAFDSVHPSGRHKSGLAMRFPRIARIRWDKPAGEADRIRDLEKLLQP